MDSVDVQRYFPETKTAWAQLIISIGGELYVLIFHKDFTSAYRVSWEDWDGNIMLVHGMAEHEFIAELPPVNDRRKRRAVAKNPIPLLAHLVL